MSANSMCNKKRYITSLKGIACLLVALGHFIGTIKYATNINLNTAWVEFLRLFRLEFLINESFYLYLFFIVSGYLVARSSVNNIKDLIVRSTTRFFRLALPIFGACTIIYLFSNVVPFYCDDTTMIFENDWLQTAYLQKFSVLNWILSPIYTLILRKPLFNSPYWVLPYMMVASFLIYFVTYLRTKSSSKSIKFIISLVLTILSFRLNKIIFACMVGSLTCYYEQTLCLWLKKKTILFSVGSVLFALCFFAYDYGSILFFSWLLIAIPQLKKAQQSLEIKPLEFLGNISFGIYSFHWPVFCSVGCLLIIKLYSTFGLSSAILISILISLIISFILSVIFYYFVEKPCGKFVNWLKARVYDILSPKKEKQR